MTTTDLFGEQKAAAHSTPTKKDTLAWWNALRHDGCLIAPSRLQEFYDDLHLAALHGWQSDRLRREISRLEEDNDREALNRLLDSVMVGMLGLSSDYWLKGPQITEEWSIRGMTGEVIKPRRVWRDAFGGILPVFIPEEAVPGFGKKTPRLGLGRSRRSVARVVEWLRKTGHKVALITNGLQWRLLHAGADYDAWCEWDIAGWFEEGAPGPQLDALRLLLGPQSVGAPKPGETPRLVAAIQATRKGQAELSSALGERVRQAVELLLRESRSALDQARDDEALNVTNRDIYIAAVRVVMRMVVVLFAESRKLSDADHLLPLGNPTYYSSYSLRGLIELLDREGGGRPLERLRDRKAAWPRLIALFRVLYRGSAHERMPITRYGGGLFTPGSAESKDPVLRALSAIESTRNEISDGVIATILKYLTTAQIRIRQGRSSEPVLAPVDFSQLDTEYIGILYEGLLDYELRRVEEAIPILFLGLGDQPALPLTRLEEMDDKALSSLVEKMGKPSKAAASEEGDGDAEEDADEEEYLAESDDDQDDEESTEVDVPADSLTSTAFDNSDEALLYRQRATAWARKAVEVGKLVKKPRGAMTEAKKREYEADIEKMAGRLVARLVLPGEYYLVRFGGTRKGSGTFYTKPQLARPTVRRTLEPLCYEEKDNKNLVALEPAQILDLKTCDPACGSGSFLVAALRYVTKALYESLIAHGWLAEEANGRIIWGPAEPKVPDWFKEMLADVPGINEAPLRGGDARTTSEGQSPEEKIRARLRRIVVERCLYGVDLDPLAVELARLALWVETMDPYLPFSFLDHKIKVGNALVGCWFDRFQDYPALAWEREGGDKSHSTGVHYPKEAWTKAIKAKKAEVKDELAAVIEQKMMGIADLFGLGASTDTIHNQLVATYQALHDAATAKDPERQAAAYRRDVLENPVIQRLRDAFDTWCALWFWPADRLDIAPMPASFHLPGEDTRAAVRDLRDRLHFFHWEIEFPDVFTERGAGFSAIIGNPPWEIQKPNSKEWFSNIDPLYRAYGKQEALDKQREYFGNHEETERRWLDYNARLKGLSNWSKSVGRPFGDVSDEDGVNFTLSRGKQNVYLHETWAAIRAKRTGYSDLRHPFLHQGSADINTYKMFLEVGHALLRDGGREGFIIPSGIYTDRGATDLRTLFLNECRWEWLFGFENRDGIFEIHRSFKFCPVIVEKGGRTVTIRAAFMVRDVTAWEEAERHNLDYPADRIAQFSPKSKAILEIRSEKDLAILEKMYANGVLLGDDGPDGWGIQYAREFDMTNDSKLFPPRPKWEARGYIPDEYGHWLKGAWRPVMEGVQDGDLRSRDGSQVIAIDDVEDVALPLYQGTMVHQFDYSYQAWLRGTGLNAVWEPIGWEHHLPSPQFLLSLESFRDQDKASPQDKLAFRDIARGTDERSFISAVVPGLPCGNVLGVLSSHQQECWPLVSCLNSLATDYTTRERVGGTHLNLYVIEELPLLRPELLAQVAGVRLASAQLTFVAVLFAPAWLSLLDSIDAAARATLLSTRWRKLWAVTEHERLRLRCILDAVVAHLYGLDAEDFRWILRDCAHPVDQVTNKAFARTLDPKGFWRVDKNRDPELRHTVLTQVAFADLQKMIATHGEDDALRIFLGTGPDDGWMLPETLRLADYNLGHDARAQQPQKVAEALGPRFYDWQLTQSAEESWEECRQHAEKIRKIRAIGRPDVNISDADGVEPKKALKPEKKLTPKGQIDFFDTAEQPEIFDAPEEVAVPAAAGMPEDRLHLYLAILLEVARTRPGMREIDAGIVLSLLHEGEKVAGRFTGDERKRFQEAWDKFPDHFLPRSGETKMELWTLTERLESLGYVTLPQEGAHRMLYPTEKRSREEWAKWTSGGLVLMILDDLENLKTLVPVSNRGGPF